MQLHDVARKRQADAETLADPGERISWAQVYAVSAWRPATSRVRYHDAVSALPTGEEAAACPCRHSLDGVALPFDLP